MERYLDGKFVLIGAKAYVAALAIEKRYGMLVDALAMYLAHHVTSLTCFISERSTSPMFCSL